MRVQQSQKEPMALDLITKLTNQNAIGTDAERHARYATGIAYAGAYRLHCIHYAHYAHGLVILVGSDTVRRPDIYDFQY